MSLSKITSGAVALLVAVVLAAGIFGARPSFANLITTFDLDGVTFADGGTATGSFVLDTTNLDPVHFLIQLISVDLATTTGTQFSGTTYSSALFSSGGEVVNPTSGPFHTEFLAIFNSSKTASIVFSVVNLSTTEPSILTPTSTYPGEQFDATPCAPFSSGCWRTIVSGSLDPVMTVETNPPPQPVSEPESQALMFLGLGLLGLLARRRKKRDATTR